MQTNTLPETGFLRVWQIVGDKKKQIPPLLPICRSTFLARVKDGTYPASLKLSSRVTVWKVEDILDLLSELGNTE